MLEKVDLKRSMDKESYKAVAPELRNRLGQLQREAKSMNIPTMIVFEGWDGAGKGTLMNKLIQAIDPRYFTVHNVARESEFEHFWAPMRRFWSITPPRGEMGIYNRSWYRRVLTPLPSERAYNEIMSFERQLAQDGYLIIKFFLHIDKKEQKKRLKALEEDPSSSWRVGPNDWANHEHYDETAELVEFMLQNTDTAHAPWTLVEAHHKEYAVVKILTTVIRALEGRIEAIKNASSPQPAGVVLPDDMDTPSILSNLDMTLSVSSKDYKKELSQHQDRIRDIQYILYRTRRPMVIVFEGMDAAGKGGCIKRLTQSMDPRGYEVSPTSAPNDAERAHQYLWRFWNSMPKAGHVGIYDRSWYGRVLVERVEGFAKEREWRRAYKEINDMEAQLVDYGTIVMKFWLHISNEEQLARFREREENPDKNWKITEEDWRNREKWSAYERCAEEMFLRTSTTHAPWLIIEGNSKEYARLKVLRHVIERAEAALK